MSTRLPVKINPFKLVEQRRSLVGELNVKPMTRLAELLYDAPQADVLQLELHFALSNTRRPMIQGAVKGKLCLECQRCLQALELPVDMSIELVLVRSDAEASRLQEQGFECLLLEDDVIFLQDMIEDELLLALPLVPKHTEYVDHAGSHASNDVCRPARVLIEAQPEDEDKEQKAQKDDVDNNPFAVLKNLKI